MLYKSFSSFISYAQTVFSNTRIWLTSANFSTEVSHNNIYFMLFCKFLKLFEVTVELFNCFVIIIGCWYILLNYINIQPECHVVAASQHHNRPSIFTYAQHIHIHSSHCSNKIVNFLSFVQNSYIPYRNSHGRAGEPSHPIPT